MVIGGTTQQRGGGEEGEIPIHDWGILWGDIRWGPFLTRGEEAAFKRGERILISRSFPRGGRTFLSKGKRKATFFQFLETWG